MKILKTNQESQKDLIRKLISAIKKGNVIISPTDTVYGLIADATNEKAINKIFKIKKRNKNKPLPIFVKDIKVAKNLAYVDKEQEKFLKSVWPGKVTVVLKRRQGIKIYGVEKNTIALRVPDHKTISYLLKAISIPLVGTSANISDKPASTEIRKIIKQFKGKKNLPDLIIDAGNLKKSLPSTTISLISSGLKILRKGEVKIK
ncbi:L-threonylcarbamoyladenylate synthase [Patescibacteria group bacterium]